jgi:ABC-type multidrug transport system fused ATPase/permease subunit
VWRGSGISQLSARKALVSRALSGAMTLQRVFRILGISLGIAVGLFALLSLDFWLRARVNFEHGEAARTHGDVQLAITYYDQAIRNYSVFGSYGKMAKERMLTIAAEYEKAEDTHAALNTYQTLLSALCAIETGFSPNRSLISDLEAKIAGLRTQVSQ